MNYVALVPLLFGERRILPGEPVPVEEGRRYDLMEFAREIQSVPEEVAPAALSDAKDEPDLLPDDFPGVVALRDAGFTTRASLDGKKEGDLTAISGIGVKTAQAILAALA